MSALIAQTPNHRPTTRAYIGVFDRDANVLTVTRAAPCGVIAMTPAYHDPRLATQRTVSAAGYVLRLPLHVYRPFLDIQCCAHFYVYSADALGSVKEQRARTNVQMSRVTAATTHGEGAVASLLNQHAAEAQRAQRTRADLTQAVESMRLLPPHNLDATKLQDAYVWKDIIPRGAWKAVNTSVNTLINTSQLLAAATDSKARQQLAQHVSPFVLGRLQAMGSGGEDGTRKHTATLLAVVASLLPLVGRSRLAPKVNGVAQTELSDIATTLNVAPEVCVIFCYENSK